VLLAAKCPPQKVTGPSLPKGELPSLILAVHTAVVRLAAEPESLPVQFEVKTPAGACPQVDHPRLPYLSGRWQTIQIFTASPGRARYDAGAIPREMGPATRLSYGCAELRGTAVCVGEADRAWPDPVESRCPQERRTVEGGQDLISRRRNVVPKMRLTPALAISPVRNKKGGSPKNTDWPHLPGALCQFGSVTSPCLVLRAGQRAGVTTYFAL
jgi:hypothetical protein